MSPPAAADPFSQLPLEIAEMILGYLKFYELMCVNVKRLVPHLLTRQEMLFGSRGIGRPS